MEFVMPLKTGIQVVIRVCSKAPGFRHAPK